MTLRTGVGRFTACTSASRQQLQGTKKRGKCRYDGRTQSFLKGLKTTSSQNKLQGSGGTRKIERKRYISYRHFINYLQFSVTRVVSHDCCQDLYIWTFIQYIFPPLFPDISNQMSDHGTCHFNVLIMQDSPLHWPLLGVWYSVAVFPPRNMRSWVTGGKAPEGCNASSLHALIGRGTRYHRRVWNGWIKDTISNALDVI